MDGTAKAGEDWVLKNITEYLVGQKLESLLKTIEYKGCLCDKCKEDMMAYALNHLPPKYVSSNEGELFARTQSLSVQYDFAVLRVLAVAIKLVEENPRHQQK